MFTKMRRRLSRWGMVLLVLTIVVCTLTVAVSAQGPRIRSAEYSNSGADNMPRLRLRFSQAIDTPKAEQFSMNPYIMYSANVSDDTMTIRFLEKPQTGVVYRLEIDNLRAQNNGRTANVVYRFKRPELMFYDN